MVKLLPAVPIKVPVLEPPVTTAPVIFKSRTKALVVVVWNKPTLVDPLKLNPVMV